MLSLTKYLQYGQTVLPNIILENYRRLGLTEAEFLFWLQLYKSHLTGDDFPDLQKIAEDMGMSQQNIYQLLNQLMQKQILQMESVKDAQGKLADRYDFSPIFEKLTLIEQQAQQQHTTNQYEEAVRQLYRLFEQEFGRPLSAIEYQRIGQWLNDDHYQPELIQCALREAVLNQAYSLNYIDRILLSWEKKNITTTQQVEAEQLRRKQQLLQKENMFQTERVLPKVTLHNWLEEE